MKKTNQNKNEKIRSILWMFGCILLGVTLFGIVYFEDQKILKNGIETVGIVDKVYWEYDVNDDKGNEKEYYVIYHFLEIESQKWIRVRGNCSESDFRELMPKCKYRVRYLKGKADRKSRIYANEPIDDSTYKAFLKQAKTIE